MAGLFLAFSSVVFAGDPTTDRLAELKALLKAGKYAEVESGARELLAKVEAAAGADSVDAARTLDMLVSSLNFGGKTREPETLQLAERAVAIKEKALGPDDLQLAVSLNNLGKLLEAIADFAAAGPMYERALRIREKALGPDHTDVAASLSSLGTLRRKTGDFAAARSLFERALAIREKALGPDHPDVGQSMNAMANLLQSTGDFAGARPLYERALAISEKTLGPSHPFVGGGLSNLAVNLKTLGDYAAARPLLERSVAIWEQALGPDHPDVAIGLDNLASLLFATGDYAGARPLSERALAITEKAVGPDHPDVADALSNLAKLLCMTGDLVAGRSLYERALAIREKALGPDHPDVAVTLNSLAGLLSDTGDYRTSRSFYERARTTMEKSQGPDSPMLADVLDGLASLLWSTGDYAAARALYERSLAIDEKALGPESPFVAAHLNNLANVLTYADDYAAARPLLERSIAIDEKALGPDHPDLAHSVNNLANVLWYTGDYPAARLLHERALAIWRRALGPDHPNVAIALHGVALVRAMQGETAGAVEDSIELERIAREHLRLTGRALSERQALRYAAVRTSGLDLSLTLAARGLDGPSRRRVLDALVRSRAVVLDEMAARHRAVGGAVDPKVVPLASALSSARARLANLVVRGVGDQTPESYRKLLDDARTDGEQAERKLAEASAGFARELSHERLGLDEVAASLPAGSALVAFAQYRKIDLTPKSPPAKKPVKKTDAAGDVPSYLAFVLRAGERDPKVVEIGSAEQIDGFVAGWKREAAGGAFLAGVSGEEAEKNYREAGAPLRMKVWDPVASAIADAGRVFVVPDGSLNLVNFASLPTEGGGYLVEGKTLVHYVSAERDLVPSAGTRRGEGLLALGGPSYDATSLFASLRTKAGGGARNDTIPTPDNVAKVYRGPRSPCGDFASVRFEPLPATEKETREIVRLWEKHGEDPRVLRPSSEVAAKSEAALDLRAAGASETALKRSAPGRRVLHLATHGFFLGGACESALGSSRGIGGLAARPTTTSSQAPPPVGGENPLLLSGLVLAGANHRSAAREGEDDGILTAEEIASLDLSGVEWAVLSACETGVGDVRAGEGVFGLRRAFQVAGAGTLIMSLWSVEDESTRAWMKALYDGRLVRKLDTAEAVREASLAVMKQRREAGESTHPFYWAAFVAAGDWR